MNIPISFSIVLSVFLLGCSNSTLPTELKPVPQQNSLQLQTKNSGQMLPIGAKAIMGGEVIELEVTETPEQKMLGLMFRKHLPDNRGMLFPLEPPDYPRFWMKNVEISLDMIFLRDGIIQAMAQNVPPCTAAPCPTYGPQILIDRVIELRGGRAAELGLAVGDRVKIEYLENP